MEQHGQPSSITQNSFDEEEENQVNKIDTPNQNDKTSEEQDEQPYGVNDE